MQRVILIDIDINFDVMKKYFLFDILEKKIEFCSKMLGIEIDFINITQSQCGNTHLHIVLKEEIDELSAIRFKYCVGEDHKRLSHSIRRFEATGKILDFFWVSKIKNCKDEE